MTAPLVGSGDFRFDVAFSFLDQDEQTARDLERLLAPSQSFVYSERQLVVAGADGVDAFTAVFRRDARIVVVLYREGWGSTRWTRVESEAIKSRFVDDGAEFLLLVKLDGTQPPDWFPVARIWMDFTRFGLPGAASVIAERVKAAGGAIRAETPEENAERLARERAREAARLGFLQSHEGARAATISFTRVIDRLESLSRATNVAFNREGNTYVLLYLEGLSVAVSWRLRQANTTQDAVLHVVEWEGRPDIAQFRFHSPGRREIRSHEFESDGDLDQQLYWRQRDRDRRTLSDDGLADFCVNLLLERVRAKAQRR